MVHMKGFTDEDFVKIGISKYQDRKILTKAIKEIKDDKDFLVFSTTGSAREWRGDFMGLYQRKGVDDSGRFYYVQEDSKDNGYFLYYCLRTKAWYLSPSLRGSACVLVNYSISLDVPTNNWRYRREGEWFVDPGLSVTSYNGHLPCSKITVALNEDVMEDLEDIKGGYIPTTDFSMGRK